MRIERQLWLSTGHIRKTTAEFLERETTNGDCYPLAVYPKDKEGWFLYWNEGVLDNIPDDLAGCISYAVENGCDGIVFDNEEEPIEALAQYEW